MPLFKGAFGRHRKNAISKSRAKSQFGSRHAMRRAKKSGLLT